MEAGLKDYVLDVLTDLSIPVERKHLVVDALHAKNPSVQSVKQAFHRPVQENCRNDEMGFFGGIWIRKLFFPTTQAHGNGHAHDFDHVTLLATGSMRVEVDGELSQVFHAPTFIVIRKHAVHNLIPQEPGTLAFCLHSFRNSSDGQQEEIERQLKEEGLTAEEFYSPINDPLVATL